VSERPLRLAVVGMSTSPTCGARDHALLLAQALDRERVSCSLHWLAREHESLRAAHAEIHKWTRTLAEELARERPDAVLLHYSSFSFAYRGVPLYLRPTLSALGRCSIPLISFMHEFAYPWRAGDWRGNVWAVTQRAALIDLMRASQAAVLTTDFRVQWLASRCWLAQRPMAIAPVFSNLPAPTSAPTPPARREQRLIGLFGYSFQGAATSLVLDALRSLLDRGMDVQLRLLGAPGHASGAGQGWLEQADARGLTDALSFTDTLPAGELSNELAACELLLSVDPPGPTSRKGTLAASLAAGRPVVAIDGPRSWSELTAAEAAIVVAPTSGALADAIAELLADEPRREVLGARGRAFAERRMSVEHSAEVVARLLRELAGAQAIAFSPRADCHRTRASR
jgi:glycosyltransferase involved in cell wall biosynthesis